MMIRMNRGSSSIFSRRFQQLKTLFLCFIYNNDFFNTDGIGKAWIWKRRQCVIRILNFFRVSIRFFFHVHFPASCYYYSHIVRGENKNGTLFVCQKSKKRLKSRKKNDVLKHENGGEN